MVDWRARHEAGFFNLFAFLRSSLMPGPNIVRWRSVCGRRRASSPNLDEWSVSKIFIYKMCWLFVNAQNSESDTK